MKKLAAILIIVSMTGCSAGITSHDSVRAAELMVDFLTSLKTEKGLRAAYDWTDDRFKQKFSLAEFKQLISATRAENSGADIHLSGYETFGSREMIIVYADSETDGKKLYFKFSLAGTKNKDYYLLSFSSGSEEFGKEGVYRNYENSIIIDGV